MGVVSGEAKKARLTRLEKARDLFSSDPPTKCR
jgi:hypothetical protein